MQQVITRRTCLFRTSLDRASSDSGNMISANTLVDFAAGAGYRFDLAAVYISAFTMPQAALLDSLGLLIDTAYGTETNIKWGIYRFDPATKKPTSVVGPTNNVLTIPLATTGHLKTDLSASPIFMEPGLYAICMIADAVAVTGKTRSIYGETLGLGNGAILTGDLRCTKSVAWAYASGLPAADFGTPPGGGTITYVETPGSVPCTFNQRMTFRT